jgi:cell division transport system permease protein
LIRLLRAIEFSVLEAFTSIRRHGLMSLAAIAITAFVFLLVGMFSLLLANGRWLTGRLVSEVQIYANLSREATLDDAHALREDILDLEGVKSARVITKEENYERLIRRYGRGHRFSGVPNMLPHTVAVTATDPQQVPRLAREIELLRGVKTVNWGQASDQSVSRLLAWARAVDIGVVVIGLLLALAVLGIVHSTIRLTLFARRREISIMQMVGATSTYVAGPFLLEGALHGTVGGAIAAGLLFLLYDYLVELTRNTWIRLLPEQYVAWGLVIMVGLGLVLGVVGSLLSVRRFLHRPVVV